MTLSAENHSDSLQSLFSKVDALDVKFYDQSTHLDSLDTRMVTWLIHSLDQGLCYQKGENGCYGKDLRK